MKRSPIILLLCTGLVLGLLVSVLPVLAQSGPTSSDKDTLINMSYVSRESTPEPIGWIAALYEYFRMVERCK